MEQFVDYWRCIWINAILSVAKDEGYKTSNDCDSSQGTLYNTVHNNV